MKPTQFELAMIAAAFTGKGEILERIESALALWEEAGKILNPPEKPIERPDSLEKLLLNALPKVRSSADRTKLFRDFIRWEITGGKGPTGKIIKGRVSALHGTEFAEVSLTGKEVADEVSRRMEDFRVNGVAVCLDVFERFTSWNESRKAGNRKDKAKKGGEARSRP